MPEKETQINFLARLRESLSEEEKRGMAWHDFNNVISILTLAFGIKIETTSVEKFISSLEKLKSGKPDLEGKKVDFPIRLLELATANNNTFARMIYLTAQAIESGIVPEKLPELRISLKDLIEVFVPGFAEKEQIEDRELNWMETVVYWNLLHNARNAGYRAAKQLGIESSYMEIKMGEGYISIENLSLTPLPDNLGKDVLRGKERARYGAYLVSRFAEECGLGIFRAYQDPKGENEPYTIFTFVFL